MVADRASAGGLQWLCSGDEGFGDLSAEGAEVAVAEFAEA